jgi:hypothetical protein
MIIICDDYFINNIYHTYKPLNPIILITILMLLKKIYINLHRFTIWQFNKNER